MDKLWQGHLEGKISQAAESFNASISFDSRMYREDITGSMAHAAMLSKQGIISSEDATKIISELGNILKEIDEGKLAISMDAEDIHSFVESVLTERLGDAGRKLHTARSRNDQVALDFRMYVRKETDEVIGGIDEMLQAIADKALEYKSVIMPGYTHLQRAQPILFAHHLLAYAQMLLRDKGRLEDMKKRLNVSPIGCCALAGTTYNTDRRFEAKELGFDSIAMNSIDGVSDRDFAAECLSDLSILMMHLSRLAEELILWSSWEYRFIKLSGNFTTGSSIMPQKRNPDIAELMRGKTGRVYGDLMQMLTMLKGLPLAYDKDMQEDKESVFDALDTVKACLEVAAPMVAEMTVNGDVMMKAAEKGFINATDLADYLTKKGVPFRTSYKLSGEIVTYCEQNDKVLSGLTLSEYKGFSELFEEDVYDAISLETCVKTRISEGSTSPESVEKQIAYLKGLKK